MNHWDWARYEASQMWDWLNKPLFDLDRVKAGLPVPWAGPKKEADPDEMAKQLAIRLFGYTVVGKPDGPAVIIPNDRNPNKSRGGIDEWVIGYHGGPPVRLEEVLETGVDKFSIVSRPLPMDTSRFVNDLAEAYGRWDNQLYRDLLTSAAGHYRADPRTDFGRELLVTAPRDLALGQAKGVKNAIARGYVVTYAEFGSLLRAAAFQLPEWRGYNGRPEQHPLAAADAPIQWWRNHYTVGGDSTQYGLWFGQTYNDDVSLLALQELPVDIHAHFESEGAGAELLWVRLTVRASGTAADLVNIHRSLHAVGHFDRVPGSDILGRDLTQLHYQTLPGSPRPPSIWPYPSGNWKALFRNIVARVDASGVQCGNLPVGHSLISGRPVYEQWGEPGKPGYHTLLIEGIPGSGKTTLALLMALLRRWSRNVLLIQMKQAEKEGAGKLIERIEGDYVRINLSTPRSDDQFRDVGIPEVEDRVAETIGQIEEGWSRGVSVKLPRAIRLGEGCEVLYAYYVEHFLTRFMDLCNRYHSRVGRVTIIIDDMASIGDSEEPRIPHYSVEVTRGLQDYFTTLFSTARERGAEVIGCIHSRDQLVRWTHGLALWRIAGYCLQLLAGGDYSTAGMWYTPETSLQATYDLKLAREALANPEVEIPTPPPGFRYLVDRELSKDLIRLMYG